MSEKDREKYERFKTTLRDQASAYESTYVAGHVEGKAEGKAEGKIETAILCKKKGMPIEDIAEITGLSIEEIEKL